jgi:hypothetical protein
MFFGLRSLLGHLLIISDGVGSSTLIQRIVETSIALLSMSVVQKVGVGLSAVGLAGYCELTIPALQRLSSMRQKA